MSQTTNINQENGAHDVEARKIAARAVQFPASTSSTAPPDIHTLLERLLPVVLDISSLTDCAAMAERMLTTWMRAQEAVSQVCPDLKLLNDSIATLKNLTSVRKSLIRLTCIAESLANPDQRPDSPDPSPREADTPSPDPIRPISPIGPISPIPPPVHEVHKVHSPTMDPMSIANYIWWNNLDMDIYSQPKVREFIGMPPVPDFPRTPDSASAAQEIRDPQLTPEPREPSVQDVPEVPFVPLEQLSPTIAQTTDTIRSFHRPLSSDASASSDPFSRSGRRSKSDLLPRAEREARMAELDRLREENRRLHPEDYLPPEQRYAQPPRSP